MSSNLNADHHPNSQTATTNQSDSNHDQQPVLAGATAESATEPSEEDGLADSNNNRIGSDAFKIADDHSAYGTSRGSNATNISNGNNSSGGNSSKPNKVERIRECINQCLR